MHSCAATLQIGGNLIRHFGRALAFGIHDKRSTFAIQRRPFRQQLLNFRPGRRLS